ncbi:MAG TPA: hypothetical protein VG965_07030 [Patescibacteria group bacterium]|nr:hypothetical protein [Patescibacteria group bacterium]
MVETLYGVIHGGSYSFEGIRIQEMSIGPSIELLEQLQELPHGSKVGIESVPEFHNQNSFKSDGKTLRIPQEEIMYWDAIRIACLKKEHEIVYLDDLPTYRKHWRKMLEAQRFEDQAWKVSDKDEHIEFLQKAYRSGVESQNIFTFEREAKIIDNIAVHQPDVVILGKGHSDYLASNPDILIPNNISFGNYMSEEVEMPYATDVYLPRRGRTTLTEGKIDPRLILERELLQRSYRAATQGRVIEELTPDFIGTWDLEIPARGLFEIYLDTTKKGGVIEDCLGTAEFSGRIDEEGAIFYKMYFPDASSREAVPGIVRYGGSFTDSGFSGRYEVPAMRNMGLGFDLRKFDGTPYACVA